MKKLERAIRERILIIKRRFLVMLGRSDIVRWSEGDNLAQEWSTRTIAMAEWIPEGAKVLEFGCGHMVLKKHLPKGCQYIPSDIVDRGHGTIVCDLNKPPLPEFSQVDIIVLSGVLEYIFDLSGLLKNLSQSSQQLILSYETEEVLNGVKKKQRLSYGWVNHYSTSELEEIFCALGFSIVNKRPWRAQTVYQLQRS